MALRLMQSNAPNASSNFLTLATVFTLVILIFVGNGELYGKQIFAFLSPAIIAVFMLLPKRSIMNIYMLMFFFIALLFQLHNIYFDYVIQTNWQASTQYRLWPIQALCTTVATILTLNRLKSVPIRKLLFFSLLLTYAFAVFSLLVLSDGRQTFIFGPNIYYRILAILQILVAMSYIGIYKEASFKLVAFFILLTLLAGLQTGSRGSLPTLMISSFACIHFYSPTNPTRNVLIAVTLAFGAFLVLEYLGILDTSRVFYFGDFLDARENSSVGVRLLIWQLLLSDPLAYILSTGISPEEFSARYGFANLFYPHNFILELNLYYGFLGFLSSLLFLYIMCRVSIVYIQSDNFVNIAILYIFLVMVVGSTFSGDFRDNYAVFALLAGMFISMKSNRFRKYSDKSYR